MTAKSIRVLVADDNRAYRRGVRIRLEHVTGVTVVGEASNGKDAVMAARSERADVVLMDLQMPGGSGIEATRVIASDPDSRTAVVVVTSHDADHFVFDALESGAVGYLLKNHDTRQLIEAIRAAASGNALVSSRVTPAIIRELNRRGDVDPLQPGPPLSVLAAAQVDLVRRLSRGETSNESLAESLGVSVNTVRSQLQASLRRTGLADRTQLALWGMRHGLHRTDS